MELTLTKELETVILDFWESTNFLASNDDLEAFLIREHGYSEKEAKSLLAQFMAHINS